MKKQFKVNGVDFTRGDFERIIASISLRAESCTDNKEFRKASHWRKIGRKLILAFYSDVKQ